MPVILSFVDKSLEVLIKLLVYSFCLFIQLQMLGYRWGNLNSKEMVEFSSKEHNKLQISIWDNTIRKTMKFLYIV